MMTSSLPSFSSQLPSRIASSIIYAVRLYCKNATSDKVYNIFITTTSEDKLTILNASLEEVDICARYGKSWINNANSMSLSRLATKMSLIHAKGKIKDIIESKLSKGYVITDECVNGVYKSYVNSPLTSTKALDNFNIKYTNNIAAPRDSILLGVFTGGGLKNYSNYIDLGTNFKLIPIVVKKVITPATSDKRSIYVVWDSEMDTNYNMTWTHNGIYNVNGTAGFINEETCSLFIARFDNNKELTLLDCVRDNNEELEGLDYQYRIAKCVQFLELYRVSTGNYNLVLPNFISTKGMNAIPNHASNLALIPNSKQKFKHMQYYLGGVDNGII